MHDRVRQLSVLQRWQYQARNWMDTIREALTNGLAPPSGPTWLLGRRYSEEQFEELQEDFSSRLWFTYRYDFPAIEGSEFTSDAGWGCMVRSGQMLLAQALLVHFLNRGWRWSPTRRMPPIYAQIVRWFLDIPRPDKCPFSIHCLLKSVTDTDKTVGEWFGPHETCVMLQRCLDTHAVTSSITSLLCDCGFIYKDAVLTAARNVPCTQRDKDATAASGLFTPILLLLPLRLGLSEFHPSYIPGILEVFSYPQSLGIIGGKPGSSLYFVGYRGEDLLYLDPHTIQPATVIQQDYSDQSLSYHCGRMKWISAAKIDPSLSVGFYIASEADFDDFCARTHRMSSSEFPIFQVGEKCPEYLSDHDRAGSFEDKAESDEFVLL